MKKMQWFKPWIPVYADGEGEGEGGGEGSGTATTTEGEGQQTAATGTPEPTEKTFTQAQVDDIVQKRLSRNKAEADKQAAELKNLKETARLTTEEKESLQLQIDDLQTRYMTKEELAAKEKKELEQNLTQKLEAATGESNTWKNRYETSTINRALTDAAVSAEALVPAQIVALLKDNTRLVEELSEDGSKTGNLVPQTKIKGVDSEGNPVDLDLPCMEAVKQMKELATNANLFKSGKTGGVGQQNVDTTPGGSPDLTSYEAYVKHRKEHGIENLPPVKG